MRLAHPALAVGKVLHTGHGNRDDEASWSVPTHKEKVAEYLNPRNSANGQLTREEALFTNQKLDEIKSLPRGAAIESMDVPDNAYAAGSIADEGISRLGAAKERGAPFFLALGFVKLPLTAPEKYFDLHPQSKFSLALFQKNPAGAPARSNSPRR